MTEAHTLLDCRWLGRGGSGRVTESLLRGLVEDARGRSWLLWGEVPSDLRPPGATVALGGDPHRLLGQAAAFRIPPAAAAVWMHQYRPLRAGAPRSVGFVYDTIPLRVARGGRRLLQLAYLRRAAALPDRVITISQHARRCLIDDLGVSGDRIDVVALPVDAALVARARRARAEHGVGDHLLAVGRIAPHKNLDALMAAFARSEVGRAGARLILVGGSGGERDALEVRAAAIPAAIEVRGVVPQDELERLLGTARALVQASTEEGFGLPVAEALASGVPVAASAVPAVAEAARGRATLFDPLDGEAMATALTAAATAPDVPDDGREPTVVELAAAVTASLERAGA